MAEYGFGLLVGKFVPCRHRFIQTESPRFVTVDGKIMRRSSLLCCVARVRHQHVVEVVKERNRSNNLPNLPLAPWHGEHGRRTAGTQPLTGQGRRSHDCNLGPATPSDARGCWRIIIPCPRSSQNSPPGLLSGRMGSLLRHVLHGASWGRHRWLCRTRRIMAHLPVLLAEAGTYLPCWVCSFQGRTNHADWSCAKVWIISCITCLSSPSSLSSNSSSNFRCLGVR